jgi:hypothetical protein
MGLMVFPESGGCTMGAENAGLPRHPAAQRYNRRLRKMPV